MTTIKGAGQMNPGDSIAEAQFTVLEVKKEEKGQYGTAYQTWCRDESGEGYVIFNLKENGNNPNQFIGKTIHVKAGTISGGEKKGQPCGLVVTKGKFKNIGLTDKAIITVVGTGGSSSPAPQASARQAAGSQPASRVDAKEFCEQKAREFLQVSEWVKPILGEHYAREIVTSILIGAERSGVVILKKVVNWRDYVFKGEKLGSYPAERLLKGIIFARQGKIKNADTVEAFIAAQEDNKTTARELFEQMLTFEEISEDIADAKLLHRWKSRDDMSDDDFYTAIRDESLLDDMKKAQAEKTTSFDDDSSVDL